MFTLDGVQPVWDKTVIDENKTTANFTLCAPKKQEKIFETDEDFERYVFGILARSKTVKYIVCTTKVIGKRCGRPWKGCI